SLVLTAGEAHHALHVLRIKEGEPVTVLDGAGRILSCEVETCSRDELALAVKENTRVPPLPCQITLLQAVPRGKIIESIIQKAVELGASRIMPLLTERVATRLDKNSATEKRDKWQLVAIEAIKQCGSPWLPKIETPVTIETFLASQPAAGIQPAARSQQFELSLVGSLQTDRRHPKEILAQFQKQNGHSPKTVGVWIGPEGDFTSDELKMIIQSGAAPISLGRLTLRVETAAIYCLSVLNYELNS
ncbi:MAG TPA: RsmE family RNA methyltransferase, partial [Verrucomicrobiae bacterium]|nr:RsmE family RNA methyltransferase [Verrucomicrobiae bacterium]